MQAVYLHSIKTPSFPFIITTVWVAYSYNIVSIPNFPFEIAMVRLPTITIVSIPSFPFKISVCCIPYNQSQKTKNEADQQHKISTCPKLIIIRLTHNSQISPNTVIWIQP